ncbi:hypothetical protein ASE48_30980 [Mycobacterium sp. Root265]|uniref:hypothetical protein n=1 Tax=Mycobacterium sp. Root265 TaxID=1736504 RepID=UPI00071005ED|nr:hypothetical protein [Mycobacterium sp. Root265]KRD13094.1 hypothetical protein ASE48_30980 [Mycobacterium sp. Root265]
MRYVLAPLTLFVRYFPQLLACYLLGYLGRTGAIEWAARVGYDNDLWASLIMPLAGMARLGSYVAMFLVIRPGIPALAGLPTRSARQIDIFATIIVPFFAIYLAWQMFREDWLDFEYRAVPYRVGKALTTPGTEIDPQMLPVGTLTFVIIGAALVARFALGRFKDRLPPWLLPIQVYMDALWVFLVLTFSASKGLTILINPSAWLAERRIVVWFNETKDSVFSQVEFLGSLWKGVTWAVGTVFGGAAVPLIWLAVACIVYGATAKADWHAEARRLGGDRLGRWFERTAPTRTQLSSRWKRVPGKVRTEVRDQFTGQIGKFKPITDSAHVIAAGGLLAISLYVLGYLALAWLDVFGSFFRAQIGSGYLLRGMSWLLGPHDITFWFGTWDALALVSHSIIEPLRICLIATTLAWCVERWNAKASAATTAAESAVNRSNP